MIKGKFVVATLMVTMLLPFCSGTDTSTPAPVIINIDDHIKKFMTIAELETAGFEHIYFPHFRLLFKDKDLYILNTKDYLIAKVTGNKLHRVYKTQKGQAPKEMVAPRSLFLYDDNTIAIYDILRISIIFFDRDLNYIKEIKLKNEFSKVARIGKNLVALLNFEEECVFGILDKDFKTVQTVVKANKKIPAERFRPWNLNTGFFLDERLVSHSYSLFPNKNCKVDIYNVYNGELVVTLPWEQPFSPTAKSINKRRNMYYIYNVGKYGSYYVVHASHSKTLMSESHYEFMIFDRDGVLKYKGDFSNGILNTSKDTMDSKLYFMDDDEGISYIDIEEFFK